MANNYLDAISENVTEEMKNEQLVSIGTLKQIQEQDDGEQYPEEEEPDIYTKTIKQKNTIMNCHQLISWKSPQLTSIQMIGIKLHNAHRY